MLKMKNIKSKILASTIIIVALSLIIIGTISCVLNYLSTYNLLESDMKMTAQIAAESIMHNLNEYKNISFESGSEVRLASPTNTPEYKKEIIDMKVDLYGFQRGNIIGADGISIFDGNDYSERDYFKSSMNGESAVSSPLISKITQETTIIISSPLWKDGVPNTEPVGVVYFVPEETFLNDMVSNIVISKNSNTYIINNKGDYVAHPDAEKVSNNENIQTLAQTDSSYKELAAVHEKMENGENGFDMYEQNGIKYVISYYPIDETENWSIAITAPLSDFMSETIACVVIVIAIMIIFIIISFIVATILASKISNPIKLCVQRLELMANGDLTSDVPEIKSNDETGELMNNLKVSITGIQSYIYDIKEKLNKMANGSFNIKITKEYNGDFKQLKDSINQIIAALNDTLLGINVSADQVTSGSKQVADAAQALSQGATEQASAIDEFAATLNDISENIIKTSESVDSANDTSQKVGKEIDISNERMNNMISAMHQINEKSSQISKVVKLIDDIAFQTNILALNAAVEAARAGEFGKGFSVVADEVRNLAAKSADAVKNTAELIEGTIRAVTDGGSIANETAESLTSVSALTKEIVEMMQKIKENSDTEAVSITQLNSSMDQITTVVQTNSATAEESSATSEQLSGQAEILKSLVSKFTLDDSDTNQAYLYYDENK